MNSQDYQWMHCVQCRSSHYFEKKMHMWQCPNCHAVRDESNADMVNRTANKVLHGEQNRAV